MAQAIMMFQSEDGALHRTREDAEFADFSRTMREDVGDFLLAHGQQDPDGWKARLLCDWELWKFGGFAGWLAHNAIEADPSIIDNATIVPASPQLPLPMAPAKAPAPERPYCKHIGIVGLDSKLHHMITQEFGEVFKLSILTPDEPQKIVNLKHCHKVFVMAKNVGHTRVKALRALGQEPFLVNGGTATLREAMLDLYANS